MKRSHLSTTDETVYDFESEPPSGTGLLVVVCGRCAKGDHGRCTGLLCWCEATPRCKANAELVGEREVSP